MKIAELLAATLIAAGSIAAERFTIAAEYDLSGDFSPTLNPVGAWSYGAKTNLEGGFVHYGIRGTTTLGGVPIEYWQLVASQEPTIYRNGTSNMATFGSSLNILPGTVWMFGGAALSPYAYGTVRFTVPVGGDGIYLVETDVAPAYDDAPQGDTDYHVVINGTEQFGQFLAPAERTGYTNSIVLNAGDTLDFMVGRGQDNSNVGSGLKTRVKITQLSAPPVDGLVFNGSFELGEDPGTSADVSSPNSTSITGWLVESGNIDYIGSRWVAGDGVRCLDLSGTDAGTISQMIGGLTVGQAYRLSFLMAANPEVATYTARLTATIGEASGEFTFNQAGITTANLGWTEKTMDFVASASTHKLTFVSLNPGWAGAALDKIAIVVNTNPPPLNRAPLAKVMVEPAFMVWPDQTNVMVIAVDGLAMDVVLDGSLSSDEDGNVLTHLWAKNDEGAPFASGPVVTNLLEVGFHTITLVVDDGKLTDSDVVYIEVLTLEDAVDELYGVLIESEMTRKDKRPLLATLDRVWHSIIDGRYNAAAKQLRAFQQKVRAQVAGKNVESGQRMVSVAQQIIDAINAYLEHHDEPRQDDKGKDRKR